jgi:hypothetical protein
VRSITVAADAADTAAAAGEGTAEATENMRRTITGIIQSRWSL